MSNTTYNGWPNKATWAVKMWIDENPRQVDEIIDKAYEAALFESDDDDHAVPHVSKDGRRYAADRLGRYVKRLVLESRPDTYGLWSDLLDMIISSVDWDRIARPFIDSILEDPADLEMYAHARPRLGGPVLD